MAGVRSCKWQVHRRHPETRADAPPLMIVVCVIACIVPARRALAVQPTEALLDY